jgi:hypothetical protein
MENGEDSDRAKAIPWEEEEIMFMYRNFCAAARAAASRWSDPTAGWLDRWSWGA